MVVPRAPNFCAFSRVSSNIGARVGVDELAGLDPLETVTL